MADVDKHPNQAITEAGDQPAPDLVYSSDSDSQALPALTAAETRAAYAATAGGSVTSTDSTKPARIPGSRGRGELTPFDSQRASEAARRRWDTVERRTRQKLGQLSDGSWLNAVDTAVEQVWDKLIATGDHRAASWLFKTAGLSRPGVDRVAAGAVADDGLRLELGHDLARELLAELRQRGNTP